jgi:acetoacetate decarboxylase
MSGKDLRRGGLDRLTLEDIVSPGFSTPWDAPMVPPFPFTFRDVEVLTLVWRTTPAAVTRLLPPPLEPTSDVVLAHIYRMNDVEWLGAYGEANVSIGCHLPGTDIAGSYSPYLFLGSDVGVVHGREVHGQPKKFGTPKLEVRGDLVVGSVELIRSRASAGISTSRRTSI